MLWFNGAHKHIKVTTTEGVSVSLSALGTTGLMVQGRQLHKNCSADSRQLNCACTRFLGDPQSFRVICKHNFNASCDSIIPVYLTKGFVTYIWERRNQGFILWRTSLAAATIRANIQFVSSHFFLKQERYWGNIFFTNYRLLATRT